MPEDMEFYDESNTSEVVSAPLLDDNIGADTSAKSTGEGQESYEDEDSMAVSRYVSAEDVGDLVVEEAEDTAVKSRSVSIEDVGDNLIVDGSNDDGEDSVYSPEERLSEYADTILSCCIGNRPLKDYALDKLTAVSSPRLFRDENYVLFSVYFAYRGKLKTISIDAEFIKLFLNRNRNILMNAKGYIDINAYGEIDGSVELGYIGGVLKHYRRLETFPELNKEEFETVFEKYLIEYKNIESSKAYSTAKQMLMQGVSIGRKKYFGFDDSQNYIKRKLAEIEGVVNMNSGSGYTTAREMLTGEKETKKSYKVCDFGRLDKLNEAYGGLYTGMMYEVVAPPKAGKSKFSARLAHTAAVVFHNNITIWAPEGGKEAFLAQMRAIHFDYIYNTGADVTERKYGVSQDAILHDRYPSDELKQLELSSKLDLATNLDYGSVDFIEKPFEVETFLDYIDTSIKSNNSVMLIIDYLQYIISAGNLSHRDAVSQAYKTLLEYCKVNNICVFTPAQYKQESFDKLIESKDTASTDMRTSGGESSEVIRTPDIIFAFWATTQDLINNTLKILSMPGRFNKALPEIDVVTDFESCQFISIEN